MAFKVGDFVKIKPGVMDAEEEKYDLGGWQGHITDISDEDDEVYYEILWDSATMQLMPQGFIQKSISEGLSLSAYNVLEEDIVASKATESFKKSEEFAEKFEDFNIFNDGSHEGSIIMQVLDGTEDAEEALDKWFDYLRENLTLPCAAEVIDNDNTNKKMGEEVIIKGLNDEFNDDYGIMANLKPNGQFPLCNLEAADKATDNWIYLQAYSVWFVNQ